MLFPKVGGIVVMVFVFLCAARMVCAQENVEVVAQNQVVGMEEVSVEDVALEDPMLEVAAPETAPPGQTPAVVTAPVASQPMPEIREEEPAPVVQVMEITDEEAPTEWVWGEVVSVNPETRAITIRHLDYTTYEEVKMIIFMGDKTLLENASGISDIKPGDHITADYRKHDDVNMAEMIVLDRPKTLTQEPPVVVKDVEAIVTMETVSLDEGLGASPAVVADHNAVEEMPPVFDAMKSAPDEDAVEL